MATEYKINLINMQQSSQKMWCFLSEPVSTISSEVYANSDTYLTVPQYTGSQQNSFTIPLQYSVQVGASNNAVGLQTRINSSVTENTDLGIEWLASYTQISGDKVPPTLSKTGTTPTDELAIVTNNYDKSAEPLNSWFGNMTYGVETAEGFIGLTWSPDPGITYQIKPKVTFYVAIGSYSTSTLADINAISTTAANVTEDDFDGNNECTVIRNVDGTWTVNSGRPTSLDLSLQALLVNSHLNLSSAHNELVQLVANNNSSVLSLNTASSGKEAERKSAGVDLHDSKSTAAEADAIITGTIALSTAIGLGFAYMFASGITLTITYRSADGLLVDFKYNGAAGANAIKEAFEAGKAIFFTQN